MMSDLASISKSPALFEYGGKQYELSPLELVDIGVIDRWLQDAPFRKARRKLEALGTMATDTLCVEVYKQAEVEAESISITNEDSIKKYLGATDGLQLMLWLAIKKKHPEVTFEAAANMMTFDTIEFVTKKLEEINAAAGEFANFGQRAMGQAVNNEKPTGA